MSDITEMEKLYRVVRKLRAEDGCPWDRVQTHESLKPEVIEEAAEVVGGINILSATGDSRNLQEELGDLLLQVVMHSVIAEEEGLFTLDDVAKTVTRKMILRHPHVFAKKEGGMDGSSVNDADDSPANDLTVRADSAEKEPADGRRKSWEEIKAQEHAGREWEKDYLPEAFHESQELIKRAMKRKGID